MYERRSNLQVTTCLLPLALRQLPVCLLARSPVPASNIVITVEQTMGRCNLQSNIAIILVLNKDQRDLFQESRFDI